MSIQTLLSRISSLRREIQTLQRQLTEQTKNEASKSGRIAQIRRSITKSINPSMRQSKESEIQRLEDDIVKIQEKQADLTKRIADKTVELHRYEQDLDTERDKEQKKFIESMRRKEQRTEQQQFQLPEQFR